MTDSSDTEAVKTPPQAAARIRLIREWAGGTVPKGRRFWRVSAVVVLIATVVWAGPLARSRGPFSAAWDKWNALQAWPILSPWSLPLGLAAVVVLILILWKVPQWQVGRVKRLSSKERFDRVNEARKTLATILGGILLLMGFFGTWLNVRVAQEALTVSQQGQITDRFTKAIEQLGATEAGGKPKLEVRLGGIYALERIANDSERDHWPIMEVLCTYVRQNAPLSAPPKLESFTGAKRKPTKGTKPAGAALPNAHPRADIQAILTVLGRRNRKYETENEHPDLHGTDLHDADLKGADLSGADLGGANLSGTFLRGADLRRADLYDAELRGAYASGANFSEADLQYSGLSGADLSHADLSGAQLFDADLSGADLFGANLTRADLSLANLGFGAYNGKGAYLRETHGLTQQQLDKAEGDPTTWLPANLHRPDSWKNNPENPESPVPENPVPKAIQ